MSAPSGAGKSTLCKQLLRRRKNLVFSISATTRMPRPGEKDGREYYFVSEAAFRAMRARRDLVEWAVVHGHLYGTPRSFLERMRQAGKDVLLDLDVQGALAVKKRSPDAVLIFIRTPRFSDLKKRLRHRSSDNTEEIRRRLKNAKTELKLAKRYDYQVVNDEIPRALKQLGSILDAESRNAIRRN
jgi:guanylate kinase